MISIDEVRLHPEQWVDTTYLRSDDKLEFREKREFGNRHAIFENDAYWGIFHNDQYNATDVPVGTVKHFSNYVEEKTGLPQGLVTLATVGLGLYAGYKALTWAENNL